MPCVVAAHYVKKLSKTGFVQSTGTSEAADLADLERWLDHFLAHWDDPDYRTAFTAMPCYHPANFQARALSCDNPPGSKLTPGDWAGGAHNVLPSSNRSQRGRSGAGADGAAAAMRGELEPEVAVVIEAFWSLSWAGITEFYHASKCLLFARIRTSSADLDGGGGNTNTTRHQARTAAREARAYVDTHCRCPDVEGNSDHRIIHHEGGHRGTMLTVPAALLFKIDRFTKVDLQLYRTAVLGFLSEIELLESGLGRRVLCDADLAKATPELAYTSLNVTALYLAGHRRSRLNTSEKRQMYSEV